MPDTFYNYIVRKNVLFNILYLAIFLFGILIIVFNRIDYDAKTIFSILIVTVFVLILLQTIKIWLKHVDEKNSETLAAAWEIIGKNEYENARKKLKKATFLSRNKNRKTILEAIIDYNQKEYKNSLLKLETIEESHLLSDSDLITFYEYKGYNLENLQKYDEAIIAFNKAIEAIKELTPRDYIIYHHRAFCHYKLKDFEEAISDYDKSIRLKPVAKTYNSKALALFLTNQLQSALDNFDRAIELNNENYSFYLNRIQLHVQMKNWDGAISDADLLLKANKHTNSAYYHRGIAFLELNKSEESIEDFNRAYSLGYKKSRTCYFRCLANCKIGNRKEALKDFTLIEDDELKNLAQKQMDKINLYN